MLVPFQRKYVPVCEHRDGLELKQWFASQAGTSVQQATVRAVEKILPNLFGYHIGVVGDFVDKSLISSSRISHQVIVATDAGSNPGADLVCSVEQLAFEANALDVLILPHALEFATDPHALLREAERVLIGEGHIVIISFNPWSLYGIWRLFLGWREQIPWRGRFIALNRIKDWLKLLGFDVEHSEKVSFRPPVNNPKISRRLRFLEQFGAFWWPVFGNVSIVVAKKGVSAVTPLKASWETRRRIVAGGVVEPTTRNQRNQGDTGG